MPPKKSPTLTEAELRLMEVLWKKGPATVHAILEELPPKPALAYNSVLTTIRILEKKGYVQHVKEGRAHVYMPLVGRNEATRVEIRNLLGKFFKNSRELLLLNLLEDKSIDAEELARMRRVIDTAKENA
ncbi:MAG TPA: BlaI/MecI/CopY family transcriptional regulator [Candidatus Angelobacter sp.]|nr:BlaI/MecI/CopY family transcriptional regulator [Candidatus Angelobacter sp.]